MICLPRLQRREPSVRHGRLLDHQSRAMAGKYRPAHALPISEVCWSMFSKLSTSETSGWRGKMKYEFGFDADDRS